MSLCQQTYRRCASIALVPALVLFALPTLLNAQIAPKTSPVQSSDDAVPKAELFLGYQWLNPGGNIPDHSVPPNAFKLPSILQGFGTNLSYNFTKNFALEGNYGGGSYRHPRTTALGRGASGTRPRDGGDLFHAHPPRLLPLSHTKI